MQIGVTVRGGRTYIIVQENLTNLIGGIFGGIGGGMGGGGFGIVSAIAGSMGVPILIPVLMPLWLATTFAVARTAFHYSSRNRMRQLEEVADRLAALAQELAPQRPALRGPEFKRLP
jgi:hypothetical protein